MNNNIHFIVGSDQLLIQQKITKIAQEQNLMLDSNNYSKYSWSENEVDWIKLKQELTTQNFFNQKIIAINCHEIKNKLSFFQKEMLQILDHTPNTVIIINEKKLEKNLEQQIKNKFTMHIVGKATNIRKNKYIRNTLDNNHVIYQENVLFFLNNNLPNNLTIIKNELEKITTYLKIHPQPLNITLCQQIINTYSVGSIFQFIEALLKGKQKEIITHYQNLESKDLNPLIFIATIQTYLLLLKKLQIYQQKQYSLDKIVQLLKKNRFFIINLIRILRNTNEQIMNNLIQKIYKMEYYVKILGWKEKTLLELFLIQSLQ